MTNKKKITKKKSIKVELPFYKKWSTYLYLIGGLLLIFLIYIIYRVQISDRKLFTLSFIPLLLGIIYENKRLSTDWKIIALKVLGSLIFSFLVFLPGKRERNYDFENHIEAWPFYFLAVFVLISVIIHDKKVVPKLTEGITLIQSISIIYWIFDYKFFENINLFSSILISVSFLISLYSLIHAFTYITLSRNARLYLSIWSSIIMIIFAVEHIFRVFDSPNIEETNILNGSIITLQYFLLGVSSMYILQNFFMLAEYLPSKNRFYDKEHLKDIKTMTKTHIERYSDKQVMKLDSLFCLLYSSSLYFINFKYQIIPRQTAIWVIILTFPYIIYLKEKIFPQEI
ncbi:hypothetical protein EQG63_08290 [Flavobacterium amnicola]|uniref:Uncharacterized protein n=1 Tax=Flavobacterium amnicola TaxID=2506422 RepID=A0A4Q1K2R0_9FLAO|nr:hypothetical protein [Flavobacterium amnicola]RXR18259.1 hypothetical protein EQG63_08290 [Flavobacterium amnicola]